MNLSSNALEVAEKRYFMEGESWEDCCRRVAKVISQVELDSKWSDRFGEVIFNGDFIPGGRVLRNCGRARGSLFNCYCIPIGDSIEAIGNCKRDALILWAEGGGVGINFSPLRPRGTVIKGKGGVSSGLVSFMKSVDTDAGTIESGGQRRAAAIAIVDISHPEIEDFIDAKLRDGELTNFNISVSITEEFLEAVENGTEWNLTFEGRSYGATDARKLWDKILNNMIKSAEPGILNWNNLRKNNSFYFAPILGVNPCGEVPLGANQACNLGSLTLPHFTTGKTTNWQKMSEVISIAVRMLDDVIDINRYTLPAIEQEVKSARRIGIGTMGLGDYLFKKGIRYGSERALVEIERVYKFIRDKVYEESVKLAVEKGTFPKYDKLSYNKASFVRKLPATLRMSIKKHGIRNCTLLAQAPTGTISLLPEVTSGIEPLFSKAYKTNDRVGERYYIHPVYADLLRRKEEIPEWFVDSYDVTPIEHFETQVATQRYTDGAVSKCIALDTLILTDKGTIPLSEFSSCRDEDSFSKVGKDISVVTDSGVSRVSSFYYNGYVDGKCVETQNGFSISGSTNHRIRVLDENHTIVWRKLEDICEGDIAVVHSAFEFTGNVPDAFRSDILLTKVVSVKDVTVETGDIEVPGKHNYIANGFISHNTINMPKGTKAEDLSSLLLEYVRDIKGATVYVDRSKGKQPLVRLTKTEARKFLKDATLQQTEQDVQCAKGTCEL